MTGNTSLQQDQDTIDLMSHILATYQLSDKPIMIFNVIELAKEIDSYKGKVMSILEYLVSEKYIYAYQDAGSKNKIGVLLVDDPKSKKVIKELNLPTGLKGKAQ